MEASIKAKSTGGLFPHSHQLEIPIVALTEQTDKESLFYTSVEYSLVFKHKHMVLVSPEMKKRILAGETVVLRDYESGRHRFEIKFKNEAGEVHHDLALPKHR